MFIVNFLFVKRELIYEYRLILHISKQPARRRRIQTFSHGTLRDNATVSHADRRRDILIQDCRRPQKKKTPQSACRISRGADDPEAHLRMLLPGSGNI